MADLPWDITVKGALERRAGDRILEQKDADQIIRGLSELEAYYIIKDLGPDDATPFLAVATRDQVRALIDLDVWRGERLDIPDLMVWLSAFREVSLEKLQEAVNALDPEVLGLLFRRRLMIARKVRDDQGDYIPDWAIEPPDEILPLMETPDARFIIAARAYDEMDDDEDDRQPIDEEDRKAIMELVMEIYRSADYETAAGLLRMAETDLSSDVEEYALRFRNARLEDLGFPPRTRAIEVYAGGDPDALITPVSGIEPAPPESRLPALHTKRLSDGLFHEAMKAIESPEIVRRIEGELMPLANAVLVADGIEPGDLDRIGATLDRVRANIELGLAHRVPPERRLEIARQRLEQLPARRLFAAGHALTVRLASRARVLEQKHGLALLDEGDRRAVEALIRAKRPLFGLDNEPRPFRATDDLERVAKLLDSLEVWSEVAATLGLAAASAALGDRVEPPAVGERTLGVLIGTLAARAILDEAPLLLPLDASALARLARVVGQPDASARATEALARVAGCDGRALEPRVARQVAEIAEALAPFASGEGAGKDRSIDPRFVGGLIRARG